MDSNLLLHANRLIRKKRPELNEEQPCLEEHVGTMLELSFIGNRCRNDAAGTCIMCDYGHTCKQWSEEDYIYTLKQIMSGDLRKFKSVLFCVNGSMLDEHQVPISLLRAALSEINECMISEVGLETHFQDVTQDKLEMIRKLLPAKEIYIEMGLESLHLPTQELLVLKRVDPEEIDRTITMIQGHGFSVVLNIMLGMPFLEASEQLEHARAAVMWAINRNCRVVAFPMNIKPFTLLSHMHRTGHYQPISHWLMIYLLNSLPVEALSKVTVAYYGNRDENYENVARKVVLPQSCPACHADIMAFYLAFHSELDSHNRKELIHQLIEKATCGCWAQLLFELEKPVISSFKHKYTAYETFLSSCLASGEDIYDE